MGSSQEQLQPEYARNCREADFQAFLTELRPEEEKFVTEKAFTCWEEIEDFLKKQRSLQRQVKSGEMKLPDEGHKISRIVELLEYFLQHRHQFAMDEPATVPSSSVPESSTQGEEQQQQKQQMLDPPQNEEKIDSIVTPWLNQARDNQKDHIKHSKKKSKIHDQNKQFAKKSRNRNGGQSRFLKLGNAIPQIPKPRNPIPPLFASNLTSHGQAPVQLMNPKRPGRLESLQEGDGKTMTFMDGFESCQKRQKISQANNHRRSRGSVNAAKICDLQNHCDLREQQLQQIQQQQQQFKLYQQQQQQVCEVQQGQLPEMQSIAGNSRKQFFARKSDDANVLNSQIQLIDQHQFQNQFSHKVTEQFLNSNSQQQISSFQGTSSKQQAAVQSRSSEVVNLCSDDDNCDNDVMQVDGDDQIQQQMPISEMSFTEKKLGTVQCVYPLDVSEVQGIEIRATDIAKLEPGVYTHDTVIEFYERFVRTNLSVEALIRYHQFSTYFLTRLCSGDKLSQVSDGQTHKMRKWLKNVDIFDKEFLLFPYNDSLHWSLFIVCYPKLLAQPDHGKCFIMHLDPIPDFHQVQHVTMELRKLLKHEYAHQCMQNPNSIPARQSGMPLPDEYFNGVHIPFVRASVPAQDNMHDCGLFVCAYLEYFLRCLPEQDVVIKFSDVKSNSQNSKKRLQDISKFPGFLTQLWFPPRNGELLRDYIRVLMLQAVVNQADSRYRGTEGYQWAQQEIRNYENLREKYLHPSDLFSLAQEKQQQQLSSNGNRRVTRQTSRLKRILDDGDQSPNLNQYTLQESWKNSYYGNQNKGSCSNQAVGNIVEEIEDDFMSEEETKGGCEGEKISLVSPSSKDEAAGQVSPEGKKSQEQEQEEGFELMQGDGDLDAANCVDLTDSQL